MPAHVHKLIAQTAIEMAHELYADLMKKNEWYRAYRSSNPELDTKALEDLWVERTWPTLVKDARTTLASMLGSNIDESLKEQIHEALILDNSLKAKRWAPARRLKGLH